MKRSLIALALFVFVAVLLLTVRVPQPVLGKAHVPVKKVQVCHRGETNTVSQNALGSHLGHGDCQLPACDFANIFQTGADCSGVGPADILGHCTGLAPRDEADGTPGCPAGGGVF